MKIETEERSIHKMMHVGCFIQTNLKHLSPSLPEQCLETFMHIPLATGIMSSCPFDQVLAVVPVQFSGTKAGSAFLFFLSFPGQPRSSTVSQCDTQSVTSPGAFFICCCTL